MKNNKLIEKVKDVATTIKNIDWISFFIFFKNLKRIIIVCVVFAIFFFCVDNTIIRTLKYIFKS